ncbi:LysR family transcriptional regulator [Vogesella indigofera]|uniref:LysR family transcriptional regulator n=1 Tax=Vogesella indigofera TaxID=45465 RepID=UPI00234D2FD0|nr:LysR family transcriptional regulator [Vogesella indigofera]MDC7705894.1 LysR family transcriptional regulator [Vogesella indigofera]MDC7708580.1 LysR family transcriptional regulator [Vogesella indigofera]MDC7711027.1 LysR family transcriptional regulator [Vogesella indigofera]
MDLRHLRYFVVVAEEGNITRAAERLHIAQPPLSRQIQQLEEELGVPLLVRGSRPLTLTEAGQFFYAHARQLLSQTRELEAMTRRIGTIERKLSIGFVGSTLYGMLPKVIRRFRSEQNTTELTLHEMTSMEQISALKEGKIDVGFGRIRHEDPNVRRIVLREERLVAALPSGHALTDRPVISLLDLVDDTLIVFPKAPRPSFADQILASFHDRGLEPKKVYEARELQVAIGLVAAGEGVAIVPASVQGLKREDVCYLPLQDHNMVSPIILSTRLLDESREIKLLIEMIIRIYEEEKIDYIRY